MKSLYPEIINAIARAPEIQINANQNSKYVFNVYDFGERGNRIEPSLTREIAVGLSNSISEIADNFDYLVAPEPGGHMWGITVALMLNCPLIILRERSSFLPNEVCREVVSCYARKNLYFAGFSKGDKVVIVDDVLSSGNTVETILSTLINIGVEICLVQVICNKSDNHILIQEKHGIKIKALIGCK